MLTTEERDHLAAAIQNYDNVAAGDWARRALRAGIGPETLLFTVSEVMSEVGEQFNCGELWLPDLIGAAEAAAAALVPIEAEILASGLDGQAAGSGTVVLGTVAGDLHSIGKSMVGAFLTASGFRVVDLGINVPADRFVQAVQNHGAKILAMSALLTTTMVEQRKVIQALVDVGLRDRVKVMVGGGAITAEFASAIGADGYGATAPAAAGLARQLLGVNG